MRYLKIDFLFIFVWFSLLKKLLRSNMSYLGKTLNFFWNIQGCAVQDVSSQDCEWPRLAGDKRHVAWLTIEGCFLSLISCKIFTIYVMNWQLAATCFLHKLIHLLDTPRHYLFTEILLKFHNCHNPSLNPRS